MADKLVKEESLTAIGDAIRTATGTTDLLSFPTGMVEKLKSMEAIPEGIAHYTGDCTKMFEGILGTRVIQTLGNKITTANLTKVHSMFINNLAQEIPFDINIDATGFESTSSAQIFCNCENLKTVPKILNLVPVNLHFLFSRCESLKEIPEDYIDTWNLNYIQTHSNIGDLAGIFNSCCRLRRIPAKMFQEFWGSPPYTSQSLYYQLVNQCYLLDEVVGVRPCGTYTSNAMTYMVSNTSRLKRLVFALQEDNTPYAVSWKNQTLDLTTTGWHSYSSSLVYYGMSENTRITDDTTYQALKDNPDAWTTNVAYSRYNHNSAVETINSLPDASAYLATAGGTNTIKFKGAAGSATDGGAINTLTEEEIAVATAKGWTVSLV